MFQSAIYTGIPFSTVSLMPTRGVETVINFDLVNWYALLGLAVTIVLGLGTKCLVDHVRECIKIESPSNDLAPYWVNLREMKTAGGMIGFVERIIFFAALWIGNGWPILSSWLIFKLAYYWQGADFTSLPNELPNKEQAAWIVAKRQIGTRHVGVVLVGTGANIIIAFIGVAVGKWIRFQ